MWPGARARRERTRAGRDGAAPTSVPLPRPPRAQRCMQAGGVHSVLAMRAKARTSARRMPGFACDWSANARPRTEARACATHGRERAQLATRIADWSIQQRLSLPGNWGRRSVAIGEGRGRGTAARARNRPFSAPHARNGVGIGSGVFVCQLQACRPNIMAGMQTGDALAAPPQCCGNEGLWGIAHGSPPAPLSRTCGRKLAG